MGLWLLLLLLLLLLFCCRCCCCCCWCCCCCCCCDCYSFAAARAAFARHCPRLQLESFVSFCTIFARTSLFCEEFGEEYRCTSLAGVASSSSLSVYDPHKHLTQTCGLTNFSDCQGWMCRF